VETKGFMIAAVLPAIAGDFVFSVQAAGQLMAIFALTYSLSSPALKALTGRFDRRKLLICSGPGDGAIALRRGGCNRGRYAGWQRALSGRADSQTAGARPTQFHAAEFAAPLCTQTANARPAETRPNLIKPVRQCASAAPAHDS
jgi:hypothetical protein